MEEEESFQFQLVPPSLCCFIVEKMDFASFSTFATTAKMSSLLCAENASKVIRNVETVTFGKNKTLIVRSFGAKNGIPLAEAMEMPYRIHSETFRSDVPITDEALEEILHSFKENGTKIRFWWSYSSLICSTEIFDKFLQTIECTMFQCLDTIGAEYFDSPMFQKLHTCWLQQVSELSDERLLKCMAEDLSLSSSTISNRGINQFFKQWRRGERRILKTAFEGRQLSKEDIQEIIEGLDANVIWTPEDHENSLLSAVDIDDLELGEFRVYSLFLAHDIETTFRLEFYGDHVIMTRGRSEKETLRCLVSKDYSPLCPHLF